MFVIWTEFSNRMPRMDSLDTLRYPSSRFVCLADDKYIFNQSAHCTGKNRRHFFLSSSPSLVLFRFCAEYQTMSINNSVYANRHTHMNPLALSHHINEIAYYYSHTHMKSTLIFWKTHRILSDHKIDLFLSSELALLSCDDRPQIKLRSNHRDQWFKHTYGFHWHFIELAFIVGEKKSISFNMVCIQLSLKVGAQRKISLWISYAWDLLALPSRIIHRSFSSKICTLRLKMHFVMHCAHTLTQKVDEKRAQPEITWMIY